MSVKRAIFMTLIVLTVFALPIQVVIDPSSVNAASTCIVVVSSVSLLFYMMWSTAIETHPLSTFMLFAFCFTTQIGALLAQTAVLTPISRSLYDPLYTFGTLAFYQAVALATHVAYRFFSAKRTEDGPQLFRGIFRWLGIYKVPAWRSLWVMGCAGLSTFYFTHFEGIVGKFALGLSFLTWAPFLSLFYLREVGDSYCSAGLNRILLVIYVGVACVFGLAFNTRAIMFQGVVTIALLYLLTGMRSDQKVTSRAVLRLALLAVVLGAVALPVSNLATSMAIARQWRGKVSATEMVKTTFFVMGKPSLLAAYRSRAEIASRYGAYDEHYVDNPLLNRIVTTKYHDNAFHFARSLKSNSAQADLRSMSIKFAWAGLPSPLLARLGIPVLKDDLTFSMGDYLAYLSRGIPLGAHRIGSMFAQGIALFGPWIFPFVYALICWLLFACFELLSVRPAVGPASIAALGMLQIWNLFTTGISYEGLHLVINFVIRNYTQMVLIYALVLKFSYIVLKKPKPVAAIRPGPPRKLSVPGRAV